MYDTCNPNDPFHMKGEPMDLREEQEKFMEWFWGTDDYEIAEIIWYNIDLPELYPIKEKFQEYCDR